MGWNNRETGGRYERMAAEFLQREGFLIVGRNYRCKSGEIDLIARDGRFLVFVEVKYRARERAGYALEAIDKRKAAQVRRVAAFYLYEKRLPEDTPCRFDTVGFDGERIIHVKDAF